MWNWGLKKFGISSNFFEHSFGLTSEVTVWNVWNKARIEGRIAMSGPRGQSFYN